MRSFFSTLAGVALLFSAAWADDAAPVVFERQDGRALRGYLQGRDETTVVVRLDKATADTRVKASDIRFFRFTHKEYDPQAVQQMFDQARYSDVISLLEPVTAPYLDYAAISNNLEAAFCLLMKAYYEDGNYEKTGDLSARLMRNPNPDVQLQASVFQALAALGQGDVLAAESLLSGITSPAAELYVQARIQNAQKHPKTAIQTVVRLIAEHPNDKDWLPPAELFCAGLYYQLDMTNAALVTARQTEKLYQGTYVERGAQSLRARIENNR